MRKYEAQRLKSKVRNSIKASIEKDGLKVEDIALREDEHGFLKLSVTLSEIKKDLTLGERLYLENAAEYDCDPEWLYSRAKQSGKAYEIIGWNPSSYKFPIRVKEIYNQDVLKINPDKLRNIFKKSHLLPRKFRSPFHR